MICQYKLLILFPFCFRLWKIILFHFLLFRGRDSSAKIFLLKCALSCQIYCLFIVLENLTMFNVLIRPSCFSFWRPEQVSKHHSISSSPMCRHSNVTLVLVFSSSSFFCTINIFTRLTSLIHASFLPSNWNLKSHILVWNWWWKVVRNSFFEIPQFWDFAPNS